MLVPVNIHDNVLCPIHNSSVHVCFCIVYVHLSYPCAFESLLNPWTLLLTTVLHSTDTSQIIIVSRFVTDGKKDLKLVLLTKATNAYKCVRVYYKHSVHPDIITLLFVTIDGQLNILGCQVV